MSGFASFPGSDVRAKLDHPVIDCDAHVVEAPFAIDDFFKQVAGNDAPARLAKARRQQYNQPSKFLWWGVPSGPNTRDRAMAMLPNYFRSRIEELGFDFAHFYSTAGIPGLYIQDDELRPAYCRALNMLYAEMFKDAKDCLRPVALVPTFTPAEAIAELDFAVRELGHKAIMIGTEIIRPMPGAGEGAPYKTGSIAIDPPHDYDPFWQRCVDLKVAPTGHTAAIGNAYHNSPSNYVFNHLGSFGVGGEYFARALLLGGVTRRFPQLRFAFLEGGVSWALTLLNDIVEHWEKRNVEHLERNLDPGKVDVGILAELFGTFGDAHLTAERIRVQPNGPLARPERPPIFDEFAACGMMEIDDLRHLFAEPFYFGCEADDRMTAVAFNRRLNPLGMKLNAVFGSDIGHWDVMDARSILSEAWSLVEASLLTQEDFRDFTFTNPAMLHLSVNPDYFIGTRIEGEAAKLLKLKKPATQAA